MKPDLFRRYVWLVETIRNAHRISFEELADLWLSSPINVTGTTLALRTFHNHRDAVADLFGIKISCDRGHGNKYYISEEGSPHFTRLKIWMLQTLALTSFMDRNADVSSRLLLDMTPDDKSNMVSVIHAMRHNLILDIEYAIRDRRGRTHFRIAPYCMRFWQRTWYILAYDVEEECFKAFVVGRVLKMSETQEHFEYPEEFQPSEYFRQFYGMDVHHTEEIDTIRVRICGGYRDALRINPIHDTQREISSDAKGSEFEFTFVPTDSFYKTIMAMGTDAEILSPTHVRDEFVLRLRVMLSPYISPPR